MMFGSYRLSDLPRPGKLRLMTKHDMNAPKLETVALALLAGARGGLYDGYHSPDGDTFTTKAGTKYTWEAVKTPEERAAYSPGGVPPFCYTQTSATTLTPMASNACWSRPEFGGMVGE
jgi:hypothetical protein